MIVRLVCHIFGLQNVGFLQGRFNLLFTDVANEDNPFEFQGPSELFGYASAEAF